MRSFTDYYMHNTHTHKKKKKPYFLSCFRVIFKFWWNVSKLDNQISSPYYRYSWILSTRSLYVIWFLFILVHVIAAIISQFEGYVPPQINPIFNCTQKDNISISVLGLLYVVGLSFVVLKLLFVHDMFHIKTELILALFVVSPHFPLWIFAVFGYIPVSHFQKKKKKNNKKKNKTKQKND